jgi:hypothetical protein
MTPEEINIAIAESVGWSRAIIGTQSKSDPIPRGWRTPKGSERTKLPDYHHDLNAIHEVVCGLTDEQFLRYVPHLKRVTDAMIDCYADSIYIERHLTDYRVMHQATAAQRCEAYLRTIGKWRDEP